MRKCLFILIALLSVSIVNAQEIPQSAVPEIVKSYVVQHYPKAKMAEWKYNKKRKAYSAEFYESGKHVKLIISESGEPLYSKEDVFTREIPAKIVSYVNKEYPNSEVLGGFKEFKNNAVSYSVEIAIIGKNANHLKTIVFDTDANIIKD